MAEITQNNAPTANPPRGPAPFLWYPLWAGAWLTSAISFALLDQPLDDFWYLGLRLIVLIFLAGALSVRFGPKVTIVSVAVAAAGVLVTVLAGVSIEMTQTQSALRLGSNVLLLVPLVLEALASKGIEWQILKEAALPALFLLMFGGFVYFVLEEAANFRHLSGAWIWLAGGTAWIGSAAFIARRYV